MLLLIRRILNWKFPFFLIVLFNFYQIFTRQKKEPSHRFDRVLVFGDSFSYTGNDTIKYNQSHHPITSRYQNRYCDDLIWVERLNILEKHSYAFPGATSDNQLYPSVKQPTGDHIPSVRQQIADHLINAWENKIDMTRSLHIIWVGFNDYLYHQKSARPEQIVKSIANAAEDLLGVGAMNLIIFNQASLQAFPFYRSANQSAFFIERTFHFNTQFRRSLAALQKRHPRASVHLFDLHTLLEEIISNKTSKRFINTINPCFQSTQRFSLQAPCSNPSDYVFIDVIHFTSSVHQLVADAIQTFLLTSFRENDPDSYIFSFQRRSRSSSLKNPINS